MTGPREPSAGRPKYSSYRRMGSHQRRHSTFASGGGGAGLSSAVSPATGASSGLAGADLPWASTTASTAARAPNVRDELLRSMSNPKESASAVPRGTGRRL